MVIIATDLSVAIATPFRKYPDFYIGIYDFFVKLTLDLSVITQSVSNHFGSVIVDIILQGYTVQRNTKKLISTMK